MEYDGTAYIGVVGAEQTPNEAWVSILNIDRRPGDMQPAFFSGTKGYELRQKHLDNFLQSDHSWLMLLDHDMIFPNDALERLRSHGVPFVSGFYMRRQFNPIYPIWFKPFDGWPMRPWVTVPEPGRLHEIGASGWGCMLIHREVIEQTRPFLKGEQEIIEDDMDLWPYDLEAVFKALNDGDLDALRREIRPLRGMKDGLIGSDIRYPFFAKQAGFQLYGDPDVICQHIVDYPLGINEFASAAPGYFDKLRELHDIAVNEGRAVWLEALERLR